MYLLPPLLLLPLLLHPTLTMTTKMTFKFPRRRRRRFRSPSQTCDRLFVFLPRDFQVIVDYSLLLLLLLIDLSVE